MEAGADVIVIYDDYGTAGAPPTSVEMWKEFTYPHPKKHVEAVHDGRDASGPDPAAPGIPA